MEEFGLGNMDIIKGLSPLPGFGATGRICGAVSGGLVALGLHFGSDDMTDYQKTSAAIDAARKFLPRFEEALGSIECSEIQEDVIFGKFMDPRASQENMQAFIDAQGHAKCTLPTGIAARLAAEIIIESMEPE
jgi:C_GCAxxG_C_C family probable redox protein